MSRRHDPDSVDAQLSDLGPDEYDLALLEHVYGDDIPPQGLHQHGVRPFGAPTDEEDAEFWDWRYPTPWGEE